MRIANGYVHILRRNIERGNGAQKPVCQRIQRFFCLPLGSEVADQAHSIGNIRFVYCVLLLRKRFQRDRRERLHSLRSLPLIEHNGHGKPAVA